MAPGSESTAAPPVQAQVSVLVVCTGNTCRSPAAMALLGRSIGADGTVVVHSAGTHAEVGSGVTAAMADLLDARAVLPVDHRARQLTPALLREPALILGMTLAHRAEIVCLRPEAVRRTFTLRELSRLARTVSLEGRVPASMAERVTELARRADAARRPPQTASDDEIADPYGGSGVDHARAVEEIDQAVRSISAVLDGLPSRLPTG